MPRGTIPELSGLVADVWVEERHNREMVITENPIEFGAPAADHAFLKPKTLSVRFGVTNTPLNGSSSFTGSDRVADAREKLEEIQFNATYLTVITISGGIYKNCLIKNISWLTDRTNPDSNIFDLDLQEIKTTKTQTTTYIPLPAESKTQNKTTPITPRGTVETKSREEANEKRISTNNASTNAEEAAETAAAAAQAAKLAEVDNKTYLLKIKELLVK